MWTLGRIREKEHARHFLGPAKDPILIEAVIDAVHDLIDGSDVNEGIINTFRLGFVDGGAGTWETTGSWLLKCGRSFPALLKLWDEFVSHQSGKVRLRAASAVSDMSEELAQRFLPVLLADRSAKVRSKVAGYQFDTKHRLVTSLLENRLFVETDPKVVDALKFALGHIRNRVP